MNWNFQNSYTELPKIYYSNVKPDDFKNPRLLLFNEDLADELNLNVNKNEDEICDFLLGKKIDIELFSTACDLQSLFYIHKELKFKKIKISSTDLANIPLLLMAGATKRKIIISSGMANIDEIDVALSALSYGYANGLNLDISKFSRVQHKRYYLKNKKYLFKHITLLHCTSDYPAALDELNLNAIETLK